VWGALAQVLTGSYIARRYYNTVGGDGARSIAQGIIASSLQGGSTLAKLNLAWCSVTDDGAIALAEALVQPGSALAHLDLRWNHISILSVVKLAEAIAHPDSRLELLDLRYNRIGDDGAAALARALTLPGAHVATLELGAYDFGVRFWFKIAAIIPLFEDPFRLTFSFTRWCFYSAHFTLTLSSATCIRKE
jgi:hypothetical protein